MQKKGHRNTARTSEGPTENRRKAQAQETLTDRERGANKRNQSTGILEERTQVPATEQDGIGGRDCVWMVITLESKQIHVRIDSQGLICRARAGPACIRTGTKTE